MKRFLGTLAAALAIVVGAALAALGALGIAVFGTDGATTGTSTPLRSDPASAAIVADLDGVEVGIPYAHLLGTPTLTVTGLPGSSVFVGTGAQADVDAFLFGVPYDLASRNGTWSTTPVPGVEQTVPDPLTQSFWLERSVGPAAEIELATDGGPTTLVVMNADGAKEVDVDLTLGFRGEFVFVYSVAVLVVGILLIALAVGLLVRAGRRRAAVREAAARDVVDVSEASASSLFAPPDAEEQPTSADGQPDAIAADERSD